MALAPTTELDAVNRMLQGSGDAPVATLSGSLPLEASIARDMLTRVSRQLQMRGWFFNREVMTLTPDGDGYVNLPANTLSVRTIGQDRDKPVVQRNGRLYNKTPLNQTFVWTGPVQVQLILGLDWTDLPESARDYISLKATRLFQSDDVGDTQDLQEDTQEEQMALSALQQEQLRAEPMSMLMNSTVANTVAGGGYRPVISIY